MTFIRIIRIASIVVAALGVGLFAVSHVWGNDTKTCPKCGKQMVLSLDGVSLESYPAVYPRTWRCKCGYSEPGPALRGKTQDEIWQEEWDKKNTPTKLQTSSYAPLPALGFTCPKCGGPMEFFGEPCPGYASGHFCAVLYGSWKCPKCGVVPNAQDSTRADTCRICGRTKIQVRGQWICPKHESVMEFDIAPGLVRESLVIARIDSLSAVVRRLERRIQRTENRFKESKAKADIDKAVERWYDDMMKAAQGTYGRHTKPDSTFSRRIRLSGQDTVYESETVRRWRAAAKRAQKGSQDTARAAP